MMENDALRRFNCRPMALRNNDKIATMGNTQSTWATVTYLLLYLPKTPGRTLLSDLFINFSIISTPSDSFLILHNSNNNLKKSSTTAFWRVYLIELQRVTRKGPLHRSILYYLIARIYRLQSRCTNLQFCLELQKCTVLAMFSLFRIKCSSTNMTSMTDKNTKNKYNTNTHAHTQTLKITHTSIHHHAGTTIQKT